jgi:hypothetical protein
MCWLRWRRWLQIEIHFLRQGISEPLSSTAIYIAERDVFLEDGERARPLAALSSNKAFYRN